MLDLGQLDAHGDLIGYLAASLVFATFMMRTMLPLRLMALASNAAFITYALVADLMPILLLHALLVPINLYRICQILKGSLQDAEREDMDARPELRHPVPPSWGRPRRASLASRQNSLRRHYR
jgi:hypothetical protein